MRTFTIENPSYLLRSSRLYVASPNSLMNPSQIHTGESAALQTPLDRLCFESSDSMCWFVCTFAQLDFSWYFQGKVLWSLCRFSFALFGPVCKTCTFSHTDSLMWFSLLFLITRLRISPFFAERVFLELPFGFSPLRFSSFGLPLSAVAALFPFEVSCTPLHLLPAAFWPFPAPRLFLFRFEGVFLLVVFGALLPWLQSPLRLAMAGLLSQLVTQVSFLSFIKWALRLFIFRIPFL